MSSSPDTSSFAATLDPRLTNGVWAFINKLLDLPRTPFSNWRNGFAYLLSLVGYILLVASLMYFLTIGSVYNKAGQFFAACNSNNMQMCAAQSSAWAAQIGFWIIPAFLGIQVGVIIQSGARKLGGMSAKEALRDSKGRYAFYLRPFAVDQTILPKPKLPFLSKFLSTRPFSTRIEEEIFDVTDGYIPLIAVGNPVVKKEIMGGLAYRDRLGDEHWRPYVRDKIKKAESIILLLDSTEGVLWELETIIDQTAASKTLFLFHPKAKDSVAWQDLESQIVPILIEANLLPLGFQFSCRPIGFYFLGSELVELYNSNWSTTSYRTAISSYLSERAPA